MQNRPGKWAIAGPCNHPPGRLRQRRRRRWRKKWFSRRHGRNRRIRRRHVYCVLYDGRRVRPCIRLRRRSRRLAPLRVPRVNPARRARTAPFFAAVKAPKRAGVAASVLAKHAPTTLHPARRPPPWQPAIPSLPASDRTRTAGLRRWAAPCPGDRPGVPVPPGFWPGVEAVLKSGQDLTEFGSEAVSETRHQKELRIRSCRAPHSRIVQRSWKSGTRLS
jgi:hypothetical protein